MAEPRVAVLIPCFNDGELLAEAVASVREPEPVEVVVIDDGSSDPGTLEELARLEAAGTRVIHHEHNQGLAAARNTGLAATRAPYVFPLDADDLAMPGIFSTMADRLDAAPDAAVCLGDYEEFGDHSSIVAIPAELDPFRLAYTMDYGPSLFRRSVVEEIGGWFQRHEVQAYEDWDLFMSLAERGERAVHLGPNVIVFRRRLHGQRMLTSGRQAHRQIYRELRRAHPQLLAAVRRNRRSSPMSPMRKRLYPFVYGRRPRFGWERRLRFWMDRRGIWTSRRRGEPAQTPSADN